MTATTRVTRPAGSGLAEFRVKPKPPKAAKPADDMPIVDRLLDAIVRRPRIRGDALGEVVGRSGSYVRAALAPYIDAGMVITAKVSVGGRSDINEYVMATAVPDNWRAVRDEYLHGRTGRTPRAAPALASVLRKINKGWLTYGGRHWSATGLGFQTGDMVRVWPTEWPDGIRISAPEQFVGDATLITPDGPLNPSPASPASQSSVTSCGADDHPAGGGGQDGLFLSPSENPGSGRSDTPPEAVAQAASSPPAAAPSTAAAGATGATFGADPGRPGRIALFSGPMGEGDRPAPVRFRLAAGSVDDDDDLDAPAFAFSLSHDGALTLAVDDGVIELPIDDTVRLCQFLADCSDWITRIAAERLPIPPAGKTPRGAHATE